MRLMHLKTFIHRIGFLFCRCFVLILFFSWKKWRKSQYQMWMNGAWMLKYVNHVNCEHLNQQHLHVNAKGNGATANMLKLQFSFIRCRIACPHSLHIFTYLLFTRSCNRDASRHTDEMHKFHRNKHDRCSASVRLFIPLENVNMFEQFCSLVFPFSMPNHIFLQIQK